MVGKRVTRYDSTQRAFCSLDHVARSTTACIAASLDSLDSAALPMAVATALTEALSVCSRSVLDVSDHAISSGSFDMVADWNCGERGGAKVSTQPYQSKHARRARRVRGKGVGLTRGECKEPLMVCHAVRFAL